MTSTTRFNRSAEYYAKHYDRVIKEVDQHSQSAELYKLMLEQINDDDN